MINHLLKHRINITCEHMSQGSHFLIPWPFSSWLWCLQRHMLILVPAQCGMPWVRAGTHTAHPWTHMALELVWFLETTPHCCSASTHPNMVGPWDLRLQSYKAQRELLYSSQETTPLDHVYKAGSKPLSYFSIPMGLENLKYFLLSVLFLVVCDLQ